MHCILLQTADKLFAFNNQFKTGLQEDLRNVIMESIKEVDPRNPWVKDSFGRHANVMALLQWPFDDSDDSDTEVAVARVRHTGQWCSVFLVLYDDRQILCYVSVCVCASFGASPLSMLTVLQTG